MADNTIRKYFIKENWIFNLEAMHDKLHCIAYDIEDGKISLPFELLGYDIQSSSDIYDVLSEAQQLESIAKSRKVTSKEYGRIKEFVEWRKYQRYVTCLNAGMSEAEAGQEFED